MWILQADSTKITKNAHFVWCFSTQEKAKEALYTLVKADKDGLSDKYGLRVTARLWEAEMDNFTDNPTLIEMKESESAK